MLVHQRVHLITIMHIAFLKKFACHSPMVGQISEKNGTKTGRRRDDRVANGHGEGGQRMEIQQRQ